MAQITYSVIMPTLGNHAVLPQAVASVLASPPREMELIVVYNGRPAEAQEVRRRLSGYGLHWSATPEPYGISRANNHGFRESRGAYVVFMHDDVVIGQPDWLERLREVLDGDGGVGMVGGSEAKYIDRCPERAPQRAGEAQACDWSPTISMARRRDLQEGCLFDEFYLVGLEDQDWALSFRRKGLDVACRPIAHRHAGTKGSYSAFLEDKALLDYYTKEGVRQRYFLDKNRDVLAPEFVAEGLRKWGSRDRDWRKSWWIKLYLKYYFQRARGLLKFR
jgi:GT2 family glycosyltransferase